MPASIEIVMWPWIITMYIQLFPSNFTCVFMRLPVSNYRRENGRRDGWRRSEIATSTPPPPLPFTVELPAVRLWPPALSVAILPPRGCCPAAGGDRTVGLGDVGRIRQGPRLRLHVQHVASPGPDAQIPMVLRVHDVEGTPWRCSSSGARRGEERAAVCDSVRCDGGQVGIAAGHGSGAGRVRRGFPPVRS
ncbi:unnamed protein product [Musa acuminata subsp. burmannicoides]